MSESMAKIRQISLYFRKILMYHGSGSMDHGTRGTSMELNKHWYITEINKKEKKFHVPRHIYYK